MALDFAAQLSSVFLRCHGADSTPAGAAEKTQTKKREAYSGLSPNPAASLIQSNKYRVLILTQSRVGRLSEDSDEESEE
jgi:hypothetical protein